MAHSEDYLDGLLNSVKNVRDDVNHAEIMAEESRKQKEEQRFRIDPQDDFMEASGLNTYSPEPSNHENLRKAFSEDDFLNIFENELEMDTLDVDEFLREFEEELEQEELEDQEDYEEPEKQENLEVPEDQEASNTEDVSFMESIENIVNQAKEQIEQDGFSVEPEPELESESETEQEAEDIEPSMDLDFMLEDSEEANTDENLMDLLSGDADLGEIGSLLQADEEGLSLEEAQEAFEAGVEAAEGGATEENEAATDVGEEKPQGFFAKLLGLFKKKESDEEVLDISPEEETNLSEENMEILKSMEEAEAAEEKKEKKKKKEKAPKEPKEKKPKKEKKEKVKKEKKPDNSPKIPIKIILIFLILALSVVALITVSEKGIGYRLALKDARSSFESGDYFTSYEKLVGVDIKEKDEDLFGKARLLGGLQKRSQEYSVFMSKEMYTYALDALIMGVYDYNENKDEAKALGIEQEYQELGDILVQTLSDQFSLSEEDAMSISRLNREDYSIRLDEIVDE